MIYRQLYKHTFLLDYAGTRFLFNPAFGREGNILTAEEFGQIDAVVVTRFSEQYFDEVARTCIPKKIQIFVQDEEDERQLSRIGFEQVQVLPEQLHFQNVDLIKMPVFHGKDQELWKAEKSFGVILSHPVLNSIYVTGDSVWFDEMKAVLKKWKPHMVLVGARYTAGMEKQIRWGMDRDEIAAVHLTWPRARILVTETYGTGDLDLGRSELKAYLRAHSMEEAVLLPNEGEEYRL